jgi:hypothetical protein
MIPDADILTKLAHENEKLREKLTIAEQWIGRELSEMHFRRMKLETTKNTKNGLTETPEEVEERCKKYFWEAYCGLNRENRELLSESEANFSYLIRQKELDGLIVTNAYQKIIENIFEEAFTKHFREKNKKARVQMSKNDILEKTLYKVIKSDFHLSLWKIYLILKKCLEENPGGLVEAFRTSVEKEPLSAVLSNGDFWEYFSDIMDTHAFGEKRHAGKITLKDARLLREKITGNFEKEGFLKIILEHLG